MKKPVSKSDLRADIEQAMAAYLREGGQIENIPRGLSGIAPASTPPAYLSTPLFSQPKTPRTLVPEVVAAIEARRKKPIHNNDSNHKHRATHRRVIYDDFGEPLRKVWIRDE
ncbi:MAG: hypothetical protein ACK5ME_12140 [Parahaliea sp.]